MVRVYSGDGDQDWGAAYELSRQHDGLMTRHCLLDRVKTSVIQHITENPQVCVLFRHPQKRIIWQFLEATVHDSGPVREQVMARAVQSDSIAIQSARESGGDSGQ